MKNFCKVNRQSLLGGVIRQQPADFQVNEIPLFKPSGQGEHVWLLIEKTSQNTDWVAGQLAKIADVPRRDVSFAGMKDRHAVTTQWFSVQMPGRDAPDWQAQLPDGVILLDEKRHHRKLKRGTLEGNRFKILIRDFHGNEDELKASVKRIQEQGVPNYFAEQRFGFYQDEKNAYTNIIKAEQWFKGEIRVKSKQQRSIYLSAARAWIFNHILSDRVKTGTWNQALQGDVFMLNGSKSCFIDDLDKTLIERVQQLQLHPTGALWGRGKPGSTDLILQNETGIAEKFSYLSQGLENKGLKQERKTLRLVVKNLNYEWLEEQKSVSLSFSLPAGAFATTVLAELGEFNPEIS